MRLTALTALFALVTAALARDLNPVDELRQSFYNLEVDLWRNVTDPAWSENGLGGDVELTKAFVDLNKQIEAVPAAIRPTLKSWLWTKTVEKLQIIDGLYNTFLEFAKRQATPGAVPSPVREWLDLTETVLLDPKTSVAQAVRKLHDLMEHGDLFRTAVQVWHE